MFKKCYIEFYGLDQVKYGHKFIVEMKTLPKTGGQLNPHDTIVG
jgi:hypothetical protein